MRFLLILLVISCAQQNQVRPISQEESAAEARLEIAPPHTFSVEYICPEKTFHHKDFLNRRGIKSCHTTKVTFPSGKVRIFNNNFNEKYSEYQFTIFRKATSRYLILDTALYEGGISLIMNMQAPNVEMNDEIDITYGGEAISSPSKNKVLINGHIDESGYSEQHYDIITFDKNNKLVHELAITENPDYFSRCQTEKKIKQCLFYLNTVHHLDKFEWITDELIEGQACVLGDKGLNYKKCTKLSVEWRAGSWVPSWSTLVSVRENR